MVRFIYGDPGTGKTELVLSHLDNDAKSHTDAILIVPEQITVAMEREIIRRLPSSAQLHIEVLNFSRLANRIFRKHGGLAYNFASKPVQKLLMWRALRAASPFLSEYHRTNNDDIALAEAMLATYKELSASGIAFDSLEQICDSIPNSSTSGKLKDITLVCSAYSSLINDTYSDTNSELSRLAILLETTRCFDNTNVYIDGFSSLTGLEHKIVKAIMAQSANCTISIGIPAPTYQGIDTLSIKRCSDALRRDCASLGVKTETITLSENHRTKCPELIYLSKKLWMMNNSENLCSESNVDETIELFRAADIYDECEFAAARIRELIESGYRYRDIAVVARNIDKYRGIIEPALEGMELSFFISEKTELVLSPLSRLILSALKIANRGWMRGDIISHLKTGLCGISARDADIFESYTAKWNISGKQFLSENDWNMNPDGYTLNKTERGEIVLHTANNVKRIFIGRLKKYVSELKNSETYTDLCNATLRYLDELDVKSSMREIALKYLEKNKVREASEFARIYDIFLDALDCVCDAFGDSKPDLNTFATALHTALDESELGSIPTSPDEITIGSADMLRTDNVKCVILLGTCDGEFPANAQNTGLLSDTDRDILIQHDLPIAGDRESRAADELYYFRRAASAPSEKLIIFTRADSEPSIAFTRIKKILPSISVRETSSNLLSRLKTYRALSEYHPLFKETAEGEAMSRLLKESPCAQYSMMTHGDTPPISAVNDSVSPDIIKNVVGKDLRLSQSKIEEFIKCKFAYSCKYYLKLDEGQRAEFAYSNIGTFVHSILEKFLYNVFITNNGKIPEGADKERLIDSIIQTYISEVLPNNNSGNNARLLHLISRLKSHSLLIIDDLLNEFSDSYFRPQFFELKIGNNEIPSIVITLKDGTRLSLNGVIDRVDIYRNNGKAYIRVVDYKTGNKTFALSDIAEGRNLQLLLYIFSLTKHKRGAFSDLLGGTPVPAGITYLSAGASKVKIGRIDDVIQTQNAAADEIKRSGLIVDDDVILSAVSKSGNNRYLMSSSRKRSTVSAEEFDQLFSQVCGTLSELGNEIISGKAEAKPQSGSEACKYCHYYSICRSSHKYDR